MPEELFNLIHSKIGEASMCWSDTPTGVFKDEQASQIARDIITSIKENTIPKPKTFKQKFTFWISSFVSGFLIYSVHYFGIAFLLWLTLKLWFPLPYLMCLGIFATLRVLYVNVTKMSRQKNKRLMKKWRNKS